MNKGLPVTNWYSKQPKLQISMIWSDGALNTSSGARKGSGVSGCRDLWQNRHARKG